MATNLPIASRRIPSEWAVAALVLASAGLQLAASLQRWVFSKDSWERTDRSVEDHLFDYAYPADPWENLGASAQLFGAGYLLLALGVLLTTRAAGREQLRVARALTIVVVVSFAIDGSHALISGILGSPSPVQHVQLAQWLLSVIAAVCLVVIAGLWLRTSKLMAVAFVLLLACTVPGYLVSIFAVAPVVAGYQSYDTTPWTETIIAISTGIAGVAVLLGAALRLLSRRSAAG